jgi:phosphohistidine phosphatase
MAKTLLIMRHSKAARDDAKWPDVERPLNERGHRDAPRIGRWLRQRNVRLDHLLASPAIRTVQTARHVAEQLDYQGPFETPAELYEGTSRQYAQQIALCPISVSTLLVVGHNPALEELVERLTGEWVTLKTSAVAWLELARHDWFDLLSGPIRLFGVDSPKTIDVD